MIVLVIFGAMLTKNLYSSYLIGLYRWLFVYKILLPPAKLVVV